MKLGDQYDEACRYIGHNTFSRSAFVKIETVEKTADEKIFLEYQGISSALVNYFSIMIAR